MNDRLTIDAKRRTRDGYLTVNARVARADNVQVYTGAEAGKPELETVRVFRPSDEVFSADTMQSFAHRPVTLGHPSSSVSSTNWRDVAKGWSDGEVARDGEFVRVSMLLADADTIAAVEKGTRELSMGYDCTLDWTPGTSPSGEPYDAIQRGIRSNHIAVVPQARGGAELRIGDSAATSEERAAARRDAAYDQMCRDIGNAYRQPHQDDRSTTDLQFARDGRPMSSLPDHERAREEMIVRQSNAWKH